MANFWDINSWLTLGASQSVRRNATDNGFEAFIPGTWTWDMELWTVQEVTAEKKFDKEKLSMKGTSTWKNLISTENTSATDYTNTLPAKAGTFAMTSDVTGNNTWTNTGDETATTITNKIGNPKLYHGVLSRLTTAPLPTNLTTPVFTLGATSTPITYYRNGVKTIKSVDYKCVLDDGTWATTTSGVLVSAKYYRINTFVAWDDFSNIATVVRWTINTSGCVFLTTWTTPTNWAHWSSVTQIVNSAWLYYIYFSDDAGTVTSSLKMLKRGRQKNLLHLLSLPQHSNRKQAENWGFR